MSDYKDFVDALGYDPFHPDLGAETQESYCDILAGLINQEYLAQQRDTQRMRPAKAKRLKRLERYLDRARSEA